MRLIATIFLFLLMDALALASGEPAPEIRVYRCTDKSGNSRLQDSACRPGEIQEIRTMQRPVDAPPAATAPKPPQSDAPATNASLHIPIPPVPELYQCTDFDGKSRDSEHIDVNRRCVPLWVLGYQGNSQACRWVEDSCVRYEGDALCERWRQRAKDAEMEARLTFGNRSAYAQSEAKRIAQIVSTHCSR
ncbi:hypothetical protein [Arenimonas sp. GDDSR-1]|uniref:DUF4124 domain-containing protein n=1 Tax=Arenimonas sp. GDDSR-1 TaxID=2950125 RepID=UPI0031B85E0B